MNFERCLYGLILVQIEFGYEKAGGDV